MNKRKLNVSEWIESLDFSTETLKDIHASELVTTASQQELYGQSIKCFKETVKEIVDRKLFDRFIPVLVVNLRCSDQLKIDLLTKPWEELESTPPSIYLIPKTIDSLVEFVEEYKKPIKPIGFEGFDENYLVYYRCFRYRNAFENNWEYDRGIYVEFRKKENIWSQP